MKKFISIRSLSLLLVLTMLVSLMAISVAAEATTATLVSDLADGDTVVVYYPAGSTALGATISGKGLVPVEATVAGDSLTVTADMGAFVVEKDAVTGCFYLKLDGKYLTSGATGNSMTLEDAASNCALWVLEGAENGFYVKNYAAAYVNGEVVKPQYLEFYNVFTTYSFNSSKANIYTFQFFKLSGDAPEAPSEAPSEEPSADAPEVVYTDIATVRTAEANEVFNIKGVVTFIDGKNVVVEDETGAINVYLKAVAEVSIGNKVAATGKKGEYNGLKQITSAEIIEVVEENATLPTATEKTLAEILADAETEALECHKVIIKNVTLGELDGSNTPITDDAGNSINIYRCPELAIAAGTKVDVVAIVSDFKGYQLRIVAADDITVAEEAPVVKENIALNKGYEVYGAFLGGKEDNGSMLTDGTIANVETAGSTVAFSGTGSTNVIIVNLEKAYNVNEIVVAGVIVSGNRQYGSVVIEVSADGVNYTTVEGYTVSEEATDGTAINYSYALASEVSAQYIKISVTASAYVFALGDIQVYGSEIIDDEPSEAPSETPDAPSEAPSETPDAPSETPDAPANPGDSSVIAILAIIGVISLAVAVVSAKRHRA